MHRSTFITMIVLSAGLFAGCHPNTAPSPGLGDPYPAPINDPQIAVLSPDLRPWLGFHPAIVVNGRSQLMRVEQPVRNLSDQQLLVEYRILFYDERGLEYPAHGWEFVAIDPKQTVRMTRTAMDNEAVGYKLEVRWSR